VQVLLVNKTMWLHYDVYYIYYRLTKLTYTQAVIAIVGNILTLKKINKYINKILIFYTEQFV